MRLAIREAIKARGMTAPNPIVGAVIVRKNKIIARGYHARAGEAHAEIAAIRLLSKLASDDAVQGALGAEKSEHIGICDASSTGATQQCTAEVEFRKKYVNLSSPANAHGATLYVTLEPCSTFGKTPPCTAAIIEAGFARVVYGATDFSQANGVRHRISNFLESESIDKKIRNSMPDPICGQAFSILKNEGIEVTAGILEKECSTLNTPWNHRMKTNMPWVIAKCGMSLDGCLIVQSGPRWITSARSRRDAMYLRAEVDAILVGGATVRTDDPALTIRGIKINENHPQPWRVVWTQSGKISKECKLLSDEHRDRTIIMQDIPLSEALKNLATRGISSVMIEGGGQTLREAFSHNLVDEIRFYVAPQLLGGPSWIEKKNSKKPAKTSKQGCLGLPDRQAMIDKIAALIAPLNLFNVSYRAIGKDIVVSALVKK